MTLPPFLLPQVQVGASRLFPSTAGAIDALPPTAAGISSAQGLPAVAAPAAPVESHLGGTRARGRVAEIYIRMGDNVFLSEREAPSHLRANAERWVDIEFPELLANDTGAARARLNKGFAGVQVGDVVEIKFAHRDNPGYFPVKEVTRVTQRLAQRNEMLAKDYERRILARTGQGTVAPAWLLQAQGHPAAANPELAAAPATR